MKKDKKRQGYITMFFACLYLGLQIFDKIGKNGMVVGQRKDISSVSLFCLCLLLFFSSSSGGEKKTTWNKSDYCVGVLIVLVAVLYALLGSKQIWPLAAIVPLLAGSACLVRDRD